MPRKGRNLTYKEIYNTMKTNIRTYNVKDIRTGRVLEWTLSDILREINSDRTYEWENYNETDWLEGWNEWVEGDIYHLIDTQ
jgi:hypothetical protein